MTQILKRGQTKLVMQGRAWTLFYKDRVVLGGRADQWMQDQQREILDDVSKNLNTLSDPEVEASVMKDLGL